MKIPPGPPFILRVNQMTNDIKILAFAGSLRKDSYNKALVKAAAELRTEGVTIDIFDLDGIPLYNQDLEKDEPAKVKEFKASIRSADALLIAIPEYNRSLPGVLKNAIDWASRPYGDNSFDDKPVATFGATGGGIGTAVAQYHFREIAAFLNMHPLEKPQMFVTDAHKKINNGIVVDEETKRRIAEMVDSLVKWTKRISSVQTK